MEVRPQLVIRISLHGAAARAQYETREEYRPMGDWSAERPVFSNGVTYLCVTPEYTVWMVTDTPDYDGDIRLESGCVTWCPASPRAAVSYSDNVSSWRYDVLHEGDIRLTCDTHQH